MTTKATLLSGFLILWVTPQVYSASIVNGSFESGFTSWVTTDLASPYSPLSVQSSGYGGYFTVGATAGTHAAYNGFDGGGPGTISISQDIGTIDLSSAILMFDYRAAWNMTSNGSTQDRVFSVVLRPNGGGSAIATFEVLRAQSLTSSDTGALSASIDLSAYTGTNARISFEAYIPQNYTGPAGMQLDNVTLTAVPEPGSTCLILLGVFGTVTLRRRR